MPASRPSSLWISASTPWMPCFTRWLGAKPVGMGRIDVYVPSGEPAPYYRWAVMTGGSKQDGFVCARMLSDMVSWPVEHGR
jgi:hypothetical protein